MGWNSGFKEDRITPCASFFQQWWVVYHYSIKCIFHLHQCHPEGMELYRSHCFVGFLSVLSAKEIEAIETIFSETLKQVSHMWCWNNKTSTASLHFWDPCFQFSSLCSKSVSASHRLWRQQHKVTYLLPFVLISKLCCKELPDFANSEGKERGKKDQL